MKQIELIELLKKGENEVIEYKRRISNDIGEDICAMANSRGGHILIGIEDDGEIIGCDPKISKESVSQHLGGIVPPISVCFDEVTMDDRVILAIGIPRSEHLHSIGGTAYIRTGVAKRPLSVQELFQLGSENLLYNPDRSPTGENEMDDRSVERFFSSSRVKILDPDNYLKKMNVWAKDGSLTVAGFLMFGKDPQITLPHTAVRMIYGDGSWQRLTGSYPDMVDAAEREFMSRIPLVSRKRGFRREDRWVFPIPALKEALVNAMVHRNLAIQSEVFVEMKPDSIVIKNPGSFPPGTSPEDPKPVPRNPILYELMFVSKYVERQGSGIDLIRKECETSGMVEFEYRLSQVYTTLTFRKVDSDLSENQRDIISILAEGDRSINELSSRSGLSRMTLTRYMKKFKELGMVEILGKGPSTRYRLK